jgi:hypothetical protein
MELRLRAIAATTPKARDYFRRISATVADLAQEFGVHETTVRRWRARLMVAAALGMMGGAAHAQSAATQAINLTASVGHYCTIDASGNGASRTLTVTTSNGKVATPGALAMMPSTSSKVICTSNAEIQLTTANGGLTHGLTPTDTNYTNKIHYTAKPTYNGTMETLTTTDATAPGFQTTGTTSVGGAQTHANLDITVDVLATPAGKFLVRGTHTDTITVTLTPTT